MFDFKGINIVKDFEHYLETLEWKNDFTRELQWVEFLQAEMDKAEQRTKEAKRGENAQRIIEIPFVKKRDYGQLKIAGL